MDPQDSKPLRLDQFLKLEGVVGSGGQAKTLIQTGYVMVNGQVEKHRRRKVTPGDKIDIFDAPVAHDEEIPEDEDRISIVVPEG